MCDWVTIIKQGAGPQFAELAHGRLIDKREETRGDGQVTRQSRAHVHPGKLFRVASSL